MSGLSVDYAALVRYLEVPLVPANLGRVLLDAVAERYQCQWSTCSLVEFEQPGATYLFDLASSVGAAQEDRTVAAWAVTPSMVGKRDVSYQRGFPLTQCRTLPADVGSGAGSLAGMATHWTLGCDAADPHRLGAFWALALGYVTEPGYDDPDGASIVDPDGVGPAIGFLRVPERKTAKNRMHIDIRVAGKPPWDVAERERLIRAKVAELLAAGASALREQSYDGNLGHIVMHDPEGNEFCIA